MSAGDAPYDATLRRRTPLAAALAQDIAQFGPLPVDDVVTRCMWDEAHGRYARGRPIGANGDFTTAPEISQVFGELIGAWVGVVWQQMGAPDTLTVMEWGPGRGTLMADLLRVADRVPGFADAATVALLEASAPLIDVQRGTLASHGDRIGWMSSFPRAITAPTILVANEFLDCLPARQVAKSGGQWRMRGVGVDDVGALAFVPAAANTRVFDDLKALLPDAPDETIAEATDWSVITDAVADRGGLPFAALFVDYGTVDGSVGGWRRGDTLQAVRNHRPEHPLTSPGEADLTHLVDFAAVADALRAVGLAIDGPTTQSEFLGALVIIQRASRLMSANPSRASDIEAAIARLLDPTGMGTSFKAIGARSSGLPPLPALPPTAEPASSGPDGAPPTRTL